MHTKLLLLHSDGTKTKPLEIPSRYAAWVQFEGACAHCGDTPFRVQGGNKRIASDDRAYEADGHCVACSNFVGTLRLEIDTLFGLREDEAVLKGRCRVYMEKNK